MDNLSITYNMHLSETIKASALLPRKTTVYATLTSVRRAGRIITDPVLHMILNNKIEGKVHATEQTQMADTLIAHE